jgi:hypothetical protein
MKNVSLSTGRTELPALLSKSLVDDHDDDAQYVSMQFDAYHKVL